MADARKFDGRFAQAEAQINAGDPPSAVALMSAVLARPGASRADSRRALLLRARAHEAMRETGKAIEDLRAALTIEARDARALNTLGILLIDSGDTEGALEAFNRAVAVDPKHARAWSNLGNTLRTTGRFQEAAAATRRAVEAKPDYALGWNNLAAMLLDIGDESAARDAYARALALKPDPATMQAIAHLERQRGNLDAAIEGYTRAAGAAPDDANVLLQLGGVLAERGDVDAARDAYRAGLLRRPQGLRLAFGEALTLPMVYGDAAEPAAARAAYQDGIARVEADLPARVRGRGAADVIDDLRWTNFLLAYQGEDDRELQERFAAIAGRAVDATGPRVAHAAAKDRRPAGGSASAFASAFFSEGTAGLYFRSWITGLDRACFEIFIYHLRRDLTPYVTELADRVDRVRTFPGAALMPSVIAAVIRADALDVLVYPELGMDVTAFALAALRLAPTQCAGWGHPVTTGHRTIDAFFTCAGMEPADAEAHYTEKIIRLPGIGTDYARPEVPGDASRARFGLHEGVPLFLCPQSLFKIHPDNDALFARVLAAVPAAQLVLFEGRHPKLTSRFRARIAARVRSRGNRNRRPRRLPDAMRSRRLPARQRGVRRHAGHAALVGGQYEPRCACRRAADRHVARALHARSAERRDAGAGRRRRACRHRRGGLRAGSPNASPRDAPWRATIRARIRDGSGSVFGDRAPVEAFAEALETLARGD